MSKYCNECEKTRPDAKYCPECGTELETPPSREESETKTPKETGSCEKCDSEISAQAERCPECGHEPSPGVLGGIVMWILGIVGGIFGLISIVIGLGIVFVQTSSGELIAGVVFVGLTSVVTAVCFGLIYFGIKNSMRGPTDPPVFD